MKTRKIIFTTALLLSGCYDEPEQPIQPVTQQIEMTHHNYFEIEDYSLTWNNIFGVQLDEYFVYFYSLTCSHCNELKDWIVGMALDLGNIYFIKESSADNLKKDISSSIGATTIDEVSILGYPSLLQIVDHKVLQNCAGKTQIQKLLNIE